MREDIQRNVTIANVQMSMKCLDKEANLEKAERLIEEAVAKGAQIVALPELFNTEYFAWYNDRKYFSMAEPMPGPTSDRLCKLAQKLGVFIVAPYYEEEGPGLYYNSALLISDDGNIVGKQRKMHMPAVRSLEKLYFIPAEANFPVFDTKYGKISICICYDRLFPEVMRAMTLNGAEIIFNPVAGTIFPHVSSLDTRALENGVFIIAPNRCGKEGEYGYPGGSMIINPRGEMLQQAGEEEETLIETIDVEDVRRTREQFPFLRDRRPELYGRLTGPAVYFNP